MENSNILEIHTIGVELLKEHSNSNGHRMLDLIQNKFDQLLELERLKVKKLQEKLDSMAKHMNEVIKKSEILKEENKNFKKLIDNKDDELIEISQENIKLLKEREGELIIEIS